MKSKVDAKDPSAELGPEEPHIKYPVFNEVQLSSRWNLSPKTLQRWRSEGRGPKYLKLSKRVSYPLETVIDFETNALHDSTSERTAR